MADQLFFEAGDKGLGADFQIIGRSLAAVKGHAVQKPFIIDIGGVAILNRTVLGRHHAAVPFLDPGQIPFHGGIVDRIFRFDGFDAKILAKRRPPV